MEQKRSKFSSKIGFVLAAAIVVIRYLMDDTLHSPEDVEKYLELSVLGTLPLIEGEKVGRKSGKRKGGKKV